MGWPAGGPGVDPKEQRLRGPPRASRAKAEARGVPLSQEAGAARPEVGPEAPPLETIVTARGRRALAEPGAGQPNLTGVADVVGAGRRVGVGIPSGARRGTAGPLAGSRSAALHDQTAQTRDVAPVR